MPPRPQLMCVCTRSPRTSPTLDWGTGSKSFKQKPLFKGGSQVLDDTRTQSIGTLFNPVEIICDFTCADTLGLIQACLFSPLIYRISGLAVWIYPQCRTKVAAFLFLFLILTVSDWNGFVRIKCTARYYSYSREIKFYISDPFKYKLKYIKKQQTMFREMNDET